MTVVSIFLLFQLKLLACRVHQLYSRQQIMMRLTRKVSPNSRTMYLTMRQCWLRTWQRPNRNANEPFVVDTTHTQECGRVAAFHLVQFQVLEESLGRLVVIAERKVEYGIAGVKCSRVLIGLYRNRTSVWADGLLLPLACGL